MQHFVRSWRPHEKGCSHFFSKNHIKDVGLVTLALDGTRVVNGLAVALLTWVNVWALPVPGPAILAGVSVSVGLPKLSSRVWSLLYPAI